MIVSLLIKVRELLTESVSNAEHLLLNIILKYTLEPFSSSLMVLRVKIFSEQQQHFVHDNK
jgi:hypothetical protein